LVFDLMGDEMDDLARALDLARDTMRLAPSTMRRSRSKRPLQTTTLIGPVSFSRVGNTTPVAVPGRWRVMTRPAPRAPTAERQSRYLGRAL